MKIDIIERYIDRLLAESTPTQPVWNLEDVRSGRGLHWNYIDGCMMSALLRMYERTGEERFAGFVCDFIDNLVDGEGGLLGYKEETYNLDNIFSGNALIGVYKKKGKQKYRKAIDNLLSQLKNQPRTKEGNYWHKKIYPNQVWLDGLYMAQVFRARLGVEFCGEDVYADVLMQFKNVRKLMFDQDKKLYRHGFDSSREVFWADKDGLSKNAWLRAVGWYAAALTDVIEVFPESIAEGKKWLVDTLNELFDGMSQYLDKESGMFLQVIDFPRGNGNYPETSGSALVGYAMLKSARLGFGQSKWKQTGMDLFENICKNYLKDKNGKLSLGGICLMAGLGPQDDKSRDGGYEYYIAQPVVENEAKGIAPFLYCYAESLYNE